MHVGVWRTDGADHRGSNRSAPAPGTWLSGIDLGNALVIELRKRGLAVAQQLEVPVYYDGSEVGKHRLDLLIENTIVVELKAIKAIEDVHFSIVRSYLRALDLKHGLLLNFGRTRLQIKRVLSHPK